MKAVVKQDFDYSRDGLTIVRLRAGEVHDISDKLAPGLLDARLIAEFVPDPPPVAAPTAPIVQAPSVAVAAPSADIRPAAPAHRSRFDSKRR